MSWILINSNPKNKKDKAHNLSEYERYNTFPPCSNTRQDLQHPHMLVDWGKLPPVCSHLLCQTHTRDDARQKKVYLQQRWSHAALPGGVEECEDWNFILYSLIGLHVKRDRQWQGLMMTCTAGCGLQLYSPVTFFFPLSGRVWPGEPAAGVGRHVWRLPSRVHAASSRGRASLL